MAVSFFVGYMVLAIELFYLNTNIAKICQKDQWLKQFLLDAPI
jgi:hypothetical protein